MTGHKPDCFSECICNWAEPGYPTKNVQKSGLGVADGLELDRVETFVVVTALFIVLGWIDTDMTAINCPHSLVECLMSCQSSKALVNFSQAVWRWEVNDSALGFSYGFGCFVDCSENCVFWGCQRRLT